MNTKQKQSTNNTTSYLFLLLDLKYFDLKNKGLENSYIGEYDNPNQ
jgi:hypothetical protein